MKKIFLGVMISVFLIACNDEKKEDKPAVADTNTAADKKGGDEILNLSEGDGVKSLMMAFSKGDVDGMTAPYDDNLKFYWSNGDSLIGKQAVKDYYTGRWKLIDSLNYSDQIVLPVKVNNPQSAMQAPGKWVLLWSNTHVKYKNGNKISFWVHTDYHYNDAGKIDIAIQYIDKHQIMEASQPKK